MRKLMLYIILALLLISLAVAGVLTNKEDAVSELQDYKTERAITIANTQTDYNQTYKNCTLDYDSELPDCEVCFDYVIKDVDYSIQDKVFTQYDEKTNITTNITTTDVNEKACLKFNETLGVGKTVIQDFIDYQKEQIVPKEDFKYEG